MDLLAVCNPSISIEGLIGTATSGSSISVNFNIGGTTWVTQATWSNVPGTLVVNILDAGNAAIASTSNIVASFAVENPNKGQDAQVVGVTLRLQDSFHVRGSSFAFRLSLSLLPSSPLPVLLLPALLPPVPAPHPHPTCLSSCVLCSSSTLSPVPSSSLASGCPPSL